MGSKNLSNTKINVGVFILIIIAVLTWPNLQIQTTELNSLSSWNNEVKIKNTVWNKGGDISGFSIIIPSVCIFASVDNNITCKHKWDGEYRDCMVGICSKVYAGDVSNKDEFILKLSDNKPLNFSINIYTNGYFGSIIVTKDHKTYFCEKTKSENYDCKIKAPTKTRLLNFFEAKVS